ncbi:TIM barrel protein [Paenarthrobacter ilicis]|uniref:Hydroxypyruvate isomerase n=1 Tax=Paenarthrobacter ilicis TaxID=43665 RepID=A0ABX0TL55_9MICC|nr:TIM barrel protein [Paenarthrobacter ilicis]MBM7791754.1 hydroxypyruvate isomerase [Paenarthrobacter ilicis]NIJ01621.1 hydroxypyruvate isomerase [Paenarthrobacter ilicis]
MSFRLAVCAEMVYGDLPLLDRVRRIHEQGFGVELWDTRGRDIKALAATGASFSSMSGYFGGSLTDASTAHEVLSSAEKLIPTALELGIERMVVHPAELGEGGRAVRPTHRSTGEMWLTGLRTLEQLGRLGQEHGIVFALENLNTILDHPGIPLARAKDTMALVKAADHPNVKMMLDLYHAQIGEGNLMELVRAAQPHTGEIQVADVPGRFEPGTGEINYPVIAKALRDAGYTGVIGLEANASGGQSVQAGDAALAAFRAAFSPN